MKLQLTNSFRLTFQQPSGILLSSSLWYSVSPAFTCGFWWSHSASYALMEALYCRSHHPFPIPQLFLDESEDFRTLSPSMRRPTVQELSLSRSLLCIDGKERERGTGREQAGTCAKGVRQVIAGRLFETRQESFARLKQSSLEQGLRTSAASCGPAGSSLRRILLSS